MLRIHLFFIHWPSNLIALLLGSQHIWRGKLEKTGKNTDKKKKQRPKGENRKLQEDRQYFIWFTAKQPESGT